MTNSSTIPPTIKAADNRRRGGSVLARMPDTAIELRTVLLSETRSGLVGLGSKRWVVMLSTGSFKISVVSSEEFTALPDVTVEPHCRQKLASGIKSAPQAEHLEALITANKIQPGFVLSKIALSEQIALSEWSTICEPFEEAPLYEL